VGMATPRNPILHICLAAIATLVADCAAPGGDGAAPSPDKPWFPPQLHQYESDLAHGDFREKGGSEIDPAKVYDLPELIDLAERTNPETRVAWERARQAAAAVGLSQSAYYPYLIASAGAGYEHAFIPFPALAVGPGLQVSVTGGGTLLMDNIGARAALDMKWLLLDFGERKADSAMAREGLMMANVAFNAVHQQIVFTVTQRFYELNTARQKVTIAESSLRATDTVAQAARARLANGLATKPEVLQAEQQSAQAAFELEAGRGALSDAQLAFVESLGILPTAKLQVAGVSEKPFPEDSADSMDDLLDRALSQRPELVTKLASLRAAQAGVRKARAAYYPKVALNAQAGWAGWDVKVKGTPYLGGNEPVYGAGVTIDWPIFDGFARDNKLRMAESELQAAEDELAHSRDSVIREVWKARTDFVTALHKQEFAAKLVAAAESAFAASLEAYQHGLGTYVDVANAERNVTASRTVMVNTRSAIYTSSAALALSVGDLARPAPALKSPRQK
jgi:outer membrane protein